MLSFEPTLGNLILTQILQHIDNGAGGFPDGDNPSPSNARILFYAGPVPESVETPLTAEQLFLGEQYCDVPSATIANKTMQFQPFTAVKFAERNGIASFFRIRDRFDNHYLQGTVSDMAGNGDIKLSNINFGAGSPIIITEFKILIP